MKSLLIAAVVGATGTALISDQHAHAAVISSWNANASDNWSVAGRWSAGIPTAAGDTANINFNISGGDKVVTIDGAVASRTVGILNIGDTNASAKWTVAASGGGTLTFDNLGANALLTSLAGSNGDVISAPIILNDNLVITNAADALNTAPKTFTISGAITTGSSKGVIINGGQGVTFSNTGNSFSSLTLASGTFNFGATSNLGGGTLVLAGGILNNTASLTLSNTTELRGDPTLGNSLPGYTNNNLNFGTAAMTMYGGSRVVTVGASRTYTFGGNIGEDQAGSRLNLYTDMGAINGFVVLNGTNSYTGGTYVNTRTTFGNAGAIPSTGSIVIGPAGSVTVTGAHTTLAAWLGDSHLSTASSGALALNGSSVENFDPEASGFSMLSLGAATNGTYTGTYTPYSSGNYYVGGGGATITFSNANAFSGSNNLIVGNGGGGTVVITGTNSYSGSTIVRGGMLQVGTAGTISTGDLVLGGGNAGMSTLQFSTGRAAGHTFGGTTFEAGVNRIMVGTITSGAVNLGDITREAGAVVVFNGASANSDVVAGKISTTTANEDYSGSGGSQTILGGWAIVTSGTGTADWAISGTGGTPGAISRLTTYTASLTAGANVGYTGGGTVGSNLTINSLKFTGAAGNGPTVNAALTIATGGILYQGIGAQNGTLFTGTGTVTSGNGKDLIISYQNSVNSDEQVSVPIVGNIGLTVSQLGGGGVLNLRLNSANTYTGETNLNGDKTFVLLQNALAFQNSTLNYNNQGGHIAFGSGISTFTFGGLKGSQSLELVNYSGDAVNLRVGNNDASTTFSGALTNIGGITKIGSGTLTFSNENTYTGATQIDEGTLHLTSAGSLVSDVTVGGASATGTPTLAGNGTVKGSLLVSGTGAAGHVAPGASIGALSVGSGATFNSGAVLDFEFGTGTGSFATSLSDMISITGDLAFASGTGVITINLLDNAGANGQGSLGAGEYRLMSYTGSLTNFTGGASGAGTFVIGTTPLPGTAAYIFSNTGTDILLTISTSYKSWTGQIGGIDGNPNSVWSVGNTNQIWAEGTGASGATPVDYADGDAVSFEDTNRTGAGSAITNYTVDIPDVSGVDPGIVTFNNTGIYTLTSSGGTGITGSDAIIKNNTGLVILSGANSISGPVIINNGAIQIADSNSLGSSSGVTVNNGGSLQLDGGITTASAVPLSLNGTGGGAGALNSGSGSNTYTGPITLAGAATIKADGDLALTGGINTVSFVATINGSGNVNIGSTAVTGSGGLTYSGIGTLTLTGAHTYTGATTVSSGLVVLNGALGNTAISIGGSGTMTALSGSTAGDAGAGSAGATLSLASGSVLNLNDGTIDTFAVSQQASFGAGNTALTIAGGTINFDLDSASTSFDLLAINVGKANVSGTNSIGISVIGGSALTFGTYDLITVAGGSLTGTFVHQSNGLSTRNITVGANNYGLTLATTGTALTITIGNAVAIWDGGDVDDDNWTSDDNWLGDIAPSANDSLVFAGTVRTSPSNDFASGTAFSGITFSNTATSTFTLSGNSITLGGDVVNGAAVNHNVNINLALGTDVNLNASAGDLTVNGVISGNQSVTIVGGNVVTLTGANSFSGGLYVTTGTLAVATVNDASTNGVFGNNTEINLGGSTGTLVYTAAADAATNMPVVLATGGIGAVQVDSAANTLTLSGAISGNGMLLKSGAGTLNLTGANNYAGGTDINAGTLSFSTGSLGTGAVKFNGGTLKWNSGNTDDISLGAGIVTGTGAISLDTNGNDVTFAGAIGVSSSVSMFVKDSLGTGSLTLANSGNTFFNLTVTEGGTVNFSAEGTPSNPAQLGTVPIIGAAGNVVLSGGTLRATSTVTLHANRGIRVGGAGGAGTITVDGGQVLTYGGIMTNNGTGVGGLIVDGAGRLIMTGSSTFTGGVTINPGATLQMGTTALTTIPGFNGVITNDGTLNLAKGPNGQGNWTYNNQINGAGSVVITGAAGGNNQAVIVVLRNTLSTYSGGLFLNSGVMGIEGSNTGMFGTAPGTAAVNITFNGGELMTYNGGGTFTPAGLTLEATRTVLVNSGGAFLRGAYGKSLIIAGQITGTGSVGVVYDGSPIIFANSGGGSGGANDYSGDTNIGATGNDYIGNQFGGGNALLVMGALNNLPYGAGKGNVNFATNPVYAGSTETLDLGGFDTRVNGINANGVTGARITSSTAATLTIGDNDQSSVFSGLIQNAAAIYKVGSGTITLEGANTNTGSYTINEGTLALAAGGSFNNSTLIVVGDTGSSGAVLDLTAKASFTFGVSQTVQGIGTINIGAGKIIAIDGIIAPGNSVGSLAVTGDLTLNGATDMEITGNAVDNTYDIMNVTGNLIYGGDLNVTFLTTSPDSPGTYTLFTFGSQSGDFDNVNLPAAPVGLQWHDYGSGDFFDNVNGQIMLEAVPEPASLGVLAIGALSLLRRKR